MAFPAPNATSLRVCISSTPKNPIAELKNGKVVFRQKPLSFEKASETMQEIVKFREMLELRVQNQDLPLVSIPEEHRPLIAKLAQESDKGAAPLARHIRSILLPSPGEVGDALRLSFESNLPLAAVEHTINTVMTRINYGLEGPLGQKLPAAVCVWRWEVRDAYRSWLPKSARDNADARLAERIQASASLRAAFEKFSQVERDAILDPKNSLKFPVNDINNSETNNISTTAVEDFLDDHIPKGTPSGTVDDGVFSENLAPKGRMKKAADPEKVTKIKDKEKRAAKVEKEKKLRESQDKSRSIMANFFGKAKSSTTQDLPASDPNALGDPQASEFQKSFRPFVLKKDAEIAPYNWFLERKGRPHDQMTGVSHEEAIVIDGDTPVKGISDSGVSSNEAVFSMAPGDPPANSQKFIEELCQGSNLSFYRRIFRVPSFKTHNPCSVRDIISQLTDAEIAGDTTYVRRLLSALRDRQTLPAKVLIFHEDLRPGYYGTWTRNSREVGPRTPLERDVLACDYGYDSGEDWEDEKLGDADDVVDDVEDDEPDEPDSDADSWLDDDDEIQPSLDLDDLPLPHVDLTMLPSKRKAENVEKRSGKRKKVVVPLIPYIKGPLWESYIGHCEYDPFNSYRIQILNDTPHPIDPFTFVSIVSTEEPSSHVEPSSALQTLSGEIRPSSGMVASSIPRRTISSAPKTVFPDVHLAALLAKITSLATPSFTFLVESIYQELRIYKIKKNAIEAKVREMGEKSKEKKIWVVKEAIQVGRAVARDIDDVFNKLNS